MSPNITSSHMLRRYEAQHQIGWLRLGPDGQGLRHLGQMRSLSGKPINAIFYAMYQAILWQFIYAIDDVLRAAQRQDDQRETIRSAEVLTVAVRAATYFQNHCEQALLVLR